MNPLWTLLPPLLVIPFIIYFGERRRNLRELSIVVAGLLLLFLNNRIYQDLMRGDTAESGSFDMMGGLVRKSTRRASTPALQLRLLPLWRQPMPIIF